MHRILAFCLAFVVGIGLVVAGIAVRADAQAPKLTDLEVAYVQIVALTEQLATCKADQVPEVKQATDVRADVLQRIHTAHPGFTIDWATGTLTPLVPPK